MPGLKIDALNEGNPPLQPARNRRIVELLREENLAEGRGTGLPRIRASMSSNGSPPPTFRFDEARTWFEVRLPTHPEFTTSPARQPAQPLRLGRPAPPDEVVGREPLVHHAWKLLQTRSLTLLGRRGRGVSSVLGASEAHCRPDWRHVSVDLAGATWEGFIAAVAQGLLGLVPADSDQAHRLEQRANDPRGTDTSLSDLLRLESDRKVVLLVDHLEVVDPSGNWPTWSTTCLNIMEAAHALPHVRVVLAQPKPLVPSSDDPDIWDDVSTNLIVPPLDPPSARRLARRLCAGVGATPDEADLASIVEASAGIPGVLVRLVDQVHVVSDGRQSAEEALDALLARRRDSTGLVEAIHAVNGIREDAHVAVLDVVASSAEGRRRQDVLAATVQQGRGRLDVLSAIDNLLQRSHLVADGEYLRFEHPLVREAWSTRDRGGYVGFGSDDIPF